MSSPDERCSCCDLPVSSCGKAAEQRQRAELAAERTRLRAKGWFTSLYPGTCASCGEPYEARALITVERPRGWRAECCA